MFPRFRPHRPAPAPGTRPLFGPRPAGDGVIARTQRESELRRQAPARRRIRLPLGGFVVCTFAALACVRQPLPLHSKVVSDVELSGLPGTLDEDELLAGLATVASGRFLGLIDGLGYEYALYNAELLSKDLERITRYLRARGYYEARVEVARILSRDEHRVLVALQIDPGPRVLVEHIELPGLEAVPFSVATEVLSANRLTAGKALDEAALEATRAAAERVLQDNGYAFAKAESSAQVDLISHRARVRFQLTPGQRLRVASVELEGVTTLPKAQLLRLSGLRPGRLYRRAALDEARRELSELGLLTSVDVYGDASRVTSAGVPIVIRVEESPPRMVRLGAGAELDALKLANYFLLGWAHHNFLGGLRQAEANARPTLIYYPTRWGSFEAPNRVLFQNEFELTLEQPSFLERLTRGLLSVEFNVFPLLFAQTAKDEGVIGFTELKAAAGLSRSFWHKRLILEPGLLWQFDSPLDYRSLTLGERPGARDEKLKPLMITSGELAAYLDLRNDPLATRRGALLSLSVQTAQPVLYSDVRDVRLRPEARLFIPISRSVVLAQRLTAGWLIPLDYGSSFTSEQDDQTVTDDQQKLLFRGFFSGGANSNRGYPLRSVGPHGTVPFLQGTRPLGGTTLWESSSEVRVDIAAGFGTVVFTDMSNISRSGQFDFASPHLSVGTGLRYRTPVGPLRLDLGYRVPGAQVSPGSNEPTNPSSLLGIPLALHLSLGEAF